jgi:predicted small secreted protein
MSTDRSVTAELDPRFSTKAATATRWEDALRELTDAQMYWVCTIRANGRPHVTPLMAVWHFDALYFCTGPNEQKAKNLGRVEHCTLITGCNTMAHGLDVVVDGDAVRVTEESVLRELATEWESKYGSDWHYEVRDGAFHHAPGEAWVYEVRPTTVFGFAKGAQSSQTRWRFGPPSG